MTVTCDFLPKSMRPVGGKIGRCQEPYPSHRNPLFSVAESILQSDPVFSLQDHYFLSQDQLYEAAVQKTFHLEMLARHLGWSEDSPERSYANRCSSRVDPSTREACLQPPSPKDISLSKGGLTGTLGCQMPLPSYTPASLKVYAPIFQQATHL